MFSKTRLIFASAVLLSLGINAAFSRGSNHENGVYDPLKPRLVKSANAISQEQKQQQPTQSPTPAKQKQKSDGETVQDDDVVRVDTDLTNIVFSAADRDKRFITTLQKDDIKVYEDGQPQEIFTFARQTELPLSLAILIDCSVSEERTLPVEKEAAGVFIDSVLRPGKDEAALLTFTGEATLELGLTGSVSEMRRALGRVQFVPPSGYIGGGTVAGTPPISGRNQSIAGSTAIWDAIWVTSDEVLSETSDKTRRAIILLTDGEDTSSQKKVEDAIQRAVKADTVVYSIGIGDAYYSGVHESVLKKISETTGGRAFFPRNEGDLRAAFAQIQLELRSQYLVAYSPTNKRRDNTFRHIKIDIVNPELQTQKLKLTYREGYFAKGSPASNSSRP